MFPFALVLEGVACMAGAWVSLVGLAGHFPKAPQWDLQSTLDAEPGIPAEDSFHRSRLFSEGEGKGWVAPGWGCLEERGH